MANYQQLKAAIDQVIKANGQKEITGPILNDTLKAIVNSLGAGYQFMGVATPSTNPGTPDQNVFYIAGQAGTYTNFNSIILPNGVSVLKWNGSWSSETVVAGDGVFDISAYKATGGTLATFADLSAALDGGNNIPSALRKGGMSVKFIQGSAQSSDNKYVQCRLMAQNFTTDVTQWQCVDDEPIAESNNLVKSNGVAKSIFEQIKSNSVSGFVEYIHDDAILASIYISSGEIYNTTTRILYTIPINHDGIKNKVKITVAEGYKYFFVANKEVYHNLEVGDVIDVSKNTDGSGNWQTASQELVLSSSTRTLIVMFAKANDGQLSLTDLKPNTLSVEVEIDDRFTNRDKLQHKFQFYNPDNEITVVEETYTSSGSIYIHNTRWALRGTPDDKTYNSNAALADALGTSVVTSPQGATNCIEIQSTYCLVYNISTSTLAIISRELVTNDNLVLVLCISGRVRKLGYGMESNVILPRVKELETKVAFIPKHIGSGYINNGYAPTFEKITNGIHISFPYSGYRIRIYNSIAGTVFDKDIDSNDIAGYDLTNGKSLVSDLDDNKLLKVVNSGTTGNYIVLLTYVWSEAVDGIFASYYNIWNRNRVLNDEQVLPIEDYWDNNLRRNNIYKHIRQADFKALFFSDIHGNNTAFSRLITLANRWKYYLDAIIDGGDDTQSYQALTNLDWYNTLAATSNRPIIRAVGNHDAWVDSAWDWATTQQVYEYFTAPAVALMRTKGLTVVQPSDAATAYRNYYYIDFGSIRVIVLLSLTLSENKYYDSDQDTWFKSVLADAKTNSKSVICVNHGPLNPDSCDQVKSNWSSYKKWNTIADHQHVDDAAVAAVDDFIDDGGKFICWLSGHTHIDYLLTSNTGTHKQFCFTTSCARNGTIDGTQPNNQNNPYYDLFNFFSVDLTNKLIKVWRIGFNNNFALQEHNTFCWDYENEVLISET